MRKRLMVAALGAAAVCSAEAANAALVAYEPFDYVSPTPPSDLNGKAGGFGFGGTWTNRQGTPDYVAGSLVPPATSPGLATAGNRQFNANSDRIGRAVDTAAGGAFASYLNGSGNVGADGTTLYVSILQQASATGQGFYALEFHRDGVSDTQRVLQVGRESSVVGAEYGVRVNNNNTLSSSLGTEDTNVNLLVVRIDFKAGNDDVRVYRNPTSLETEPGAAAAQLLSVGDLSFDEISLGAFSGTKTVSHDEIRFGDTYASVLPVPEPGIVGLMGVGVIAMLRRGRR